MTPPPPFPPPPRAPTASGPEAVRASVALLDVGWHVGAPGATSYPPAWPDLAALVARLGERYVAVGPWLPSSGTAERPFEGEPGFEGYEEACRAAGLPVRVGRWAVPGRPRVILVDGAALAPRRDAILAGLWNAHGVDSLFGSHEYVERVLFGYAAGMAIERWWAVPPRRPAAGAVAVFHRWEAAAGLLYLLERAPDLGTVLALPGTVLGSRLASTGRSPAEVAALHEARGVAEPLGLRAEHSLESGAAREADVLLSLSDTTGEGASTEGTGEGKGDDETARILGRRADAKVPRPTNGTPDPVQVFLPMLGQALRAARERAARAPVAAAAPAAFHGAPAVLPEGLKPLETIARNYRWSWDTEARDLFETLSPAAWEMASHDPVRTLAAALPEDVALRAADAGFVERVRRVAERLEAELAAPRLEGLPIAYFSAEYGIHESLAIYSGGLGVLAGDHLKSAGDLGLPLVAVGVYYRKGRQTQRMSAGGDQVLTSVVAHPDERALEPVLDAAGRPLEIVVDVAEHPVRVRAWRTRVGRVDLHLLDTDVEENRPEDRGITHLPYPSEPEARLKKEIVLGRAGLRLLARLGIAPAVLHLNEGHPAFAAVERVAWAMQTKGTAFDAALADVRATTVFTTHTPVPAGHDRFEEHLIRTYLPDLPEALGVPWERILALGREEGTPPQFNMTRLAISLAARVNGVSVIHAAVSRRLLAPAWPGVPEAEVPVKAVTNGIHLPTWTAPEIAGLLGAAGRRVTGEDFAKRAAGLDPVALWAVRRRLRRRLLLAVRARIEARYAEQGAPPSVADRYTTGLDEGALLIGFARRFTGYKRGALLLRDLGRLEKVVQRSERPVRFFFAGKSHRDDLEGQRILRQVVEASRGGVLAGKVFFLDDYEMALARHLVQGVDVWLNNPLRGLEASGTSGMKVAANGGLNLSVLDGWWPEAHDGTNGWAVGPAEAPQDGKYADGRSEDDVDAEAAYRLLEEEVVPLFFDRDVAGIPQRWLERVRRSLATIPPFFNTDRMVLEYAAWGYAPAPAEVPTDVPTATPASG